MTAGYVSQSWNGGAGTTSVTVTKPTSVTLGCQLVAYLSNIGGDLGTLTLPDASWKVLATNSATEGGNVLYGALVVKTAGASEPSSYTFGWANSGANVFLTLANFGTPATAIVGNAAVVIVPDGIASSWSAAPITGSALQICAKQFPNSSDAGTSEISGMTRAAVLTHSNVIYTATVSPGAVPTRTSAGSSTSGVGGSMLFGLLLSIPSAPANASLQSPISGQPEDAMTTIPLNAGYNSTDGADCNAYALRIKLSGGSYGYYKASDGTITSSSPVWNTLGTTVPDGGTVSVTLAANKLTNGNTYNWSMAMQESSASLQGTFATDATFVTQTAPTVTATGPTGTITSTTAPATTWTESLHSGSAQLSFRCVWESGSYGSVPGSGTPEFDTGTVVSSALTVTPDPLDNSKTYRCFVMITQTGPQDSGWSHTDFTLNVTPPNVPTLVGSATADGLTGQPVVNLAVTGHDSGPTWDHTNTFFQVQSSIDAGVTWGDVRAGSLLTPNGSDAASVQDPEPPFGGAGVTYRARTIGTPANPITSAWTATVTVPVTSDLLWLNDPLDLTSAIQVGIVTDDQRQSPITQDITVTLGSTQPIVTSDVRQVQSGTFTFVVFTTADRAALLALLNRSRTLLARFPGEQDEQGDLIYFLPTGPLNVARYAQAAIPGRTVATTWIERAKP